VILVIALTALSFNNAFEFTNLAEVKELRGSSYGNSLIETISLTLQNSGNLDEITKLLDDLLYKLNKDQEDADRDWDKTNRTLIEKVGDLVDEIEHLRVEISDKTKEQADYQAKLDQAVINLGQYNDQHAYNLATIADLDVKRAADNAEYKRSIQDHNDVINAIQEVINELTKLQGSISGTNKPAHVDPIDSETRDRDWKSRVDAATLAASFVQLSKNQKDAMIFAELASSADQDALSKLLGLLNNLSDSAKQSLNDDETHEQNSISTHDSLFSILNEDNAKLESNIKDQNSHQKEYSDKVTALTVEITSLTGIKTSKEEERDATIKERATKETQYLSDKFERDGERKVIEKLQGIVRERLHNMSKFLKAENSSS